jgi:hypothetical protein
MTIIYCLRFETPPTWRARSPYLYPPTNRVAKLYAQALGFLFVVFGWILYLYNFGTDKIENAISNNSFVAVSLVGAAETCLTAIT